MDNLHNSKILVVDDNEDNLELIEDFLDDEGYENIICVLGAKEAYDVLSSHNIDLIILDIMMPEIDGLKACEYIKSHPEYEDIPIIIATAKADLDTLKAGFEAGANDYVRKPITNDVELLARVKNALTMKIQLNYIKNINKTLDTKIKDEIEKNHKKDLLMQEQTKLAAMGEMVGSIAHQWRQPLNALSINIQNLEDDFADGLIDEKFLDEFMGKNRKIITFMSDTIDDFRNFFRIDKEKTKFSALESVDSVVNILGAVMKSNGIELKIVGDDFEIYGFKNEFSQVIMNIINNAKDALIEKNIKDKVVSLKLDNHSIFIEDNAGGIEETIISRIFEPYFTTKEQGKGTGMGLCMSKMIIEDNMNGKLKARNINDGVVFEIILDSECDKC